MEEKGIVPQELSCRTAAELPPPELPPKLGRQLRQLRWQELGGRSSAAVRQLRRRKGWYSRSLAAELPQPELLVRWSTKS